MKIQQREVIVVGFPNHYRLETSDTNSYLPESVYESVSLAKQNAKALFPGERVKFTQVNIDPESYYAMFNE